MGTRAAVPSKRTERTAQRAGSTVDAASRGAGEGHTDALRLASGPSTLGPERVIEIQRARILAAMLDMCAEHGAANVAVASVVQRAGVSRRTFYEIFTSYEDCFLAAFDEAVARAGAYLALAYDPGAPWVRRIRSATVALLRFLDAEPTTARLLVLDSLSMGPAALQRRQQLLARMATVVDEGRLSTRTNKGANGDAELSDLTAEGVVGGALSVVHARMLGPLPVRLLGLAGPLVSMIVLPYLGPAAARNELKLVVPRIAEQPAPEPVPRDPLRDLEIRLTYRTVRVLLAVVQQPGASNRQIARLAGIADPGQISKLLARLDRLDLVENLGLTPGKGAPNSWALTERGHEVANAMNTDTVNTREPR